MRQLTVTNAMGHMVSSTFNNLGFALKAQWPWFVVVAIFTTAVTYSWGYDLLTNEADLRKYLNDNPAKSIQFLLTFLAAGLLFLLSFASIAVNWHRYVLMDEVPSALSEKLRIDALVWRYLGNLILISLALFVLVIPMFLLVGVLSAIGGLVGFAALIICVMLVIIPVFYRMSIKLPAIAVGRTDFRFRDAWVASSGNWWQIVGVAFLFTIISWCVGLVLLALSFLLQKVLGPVVGVGADVVLQIVANWILTVMGITLLTSLYGFFVEKRDF